MKVKEKSAMAKEIIKSISTHDDAPWKDVAGALDDLANFIEVEKSRADKHRTKLEAQKARES